MAQHIHASSTRIILVWLELYLNPFSSLKKKVWHIQLALKGSYISNLAATQIASKRENNHQKGKITTKKILPRKSVSEIKTFEKSSSITRPEGLTTKPQIYIYI